VGRRVTGEEDRQRNITLKREFEKLRRAR